MVGRTAHRTQADDARMDAIAEIGCIACLLDGWPGVPCQVDHLLKGGERHDEQHRHTVGLCPWHHAGHPIPAHCCGSVAEATAHHGPSRRHHSKAFADRYGGDEQLLALQNALLRYREGTLLRNEFATPGQYCSLVRRLRFQIGTAL